MNRQQRRAVERKKGDSEQILADQTRLFGKLPEECSACKNSFDKTDREMVFSWKVVVKEETVRLFCPNCLNKTKEIINERK